MNNSSNTLPPLGLALPKEPPCAGASGPPSPARGSAGMAPPPTSVATARNPLNQLNQQPWSGAPAPSAATTTTTSTETQKPEAPETGLLTISRVLSDCISNNFAEPRTDLKQEEEIYPSTLKEVPAVNLQVSQEEKPSNSSSNRKRKKSPEKDNGKVKKLNNQVEVKTEEVLKHRIENLTNGPVINNDLSKGPKLNNQCLSSTLSNKLLKITKSLKSKLESTKTDSSEKSSTKESKKKREHIKSRRKSYNLLTASGNLDLAVDSKKRRKSINSLSTDLSLQNVDFIIKNSELISSTIDCHQVAQDLGIVGVDTCMLEANNNDKNQNLNKISALSLLTFNSNCKKKNGAKTAKSELGIVAATAAAAPLEILPLHTKDKIQGKKLQKKNLTHSKGSSKTETCTKPIVPVICKKPTTDVVNNCQELVPISSLKKSLPTLKWSNGWSWEGQPFKAKVYLTNDNPPVVRKCYPAMRHTEGDMISSRDCILLKSGPRKIDLPFVAKVSSLWENPDDGEMMVSLLWYYRPEHTEQGRRPEDTVDEIFASRHKDTNSVACIEDKCYVLTFNEYCRYRKSIKRVEDCVYRTNTVVPAPEDGRYPRFNRLPPGRVAPDLVFFCRRVYDFKQKRILKNPC